jgi:HD-like signal output (HDOD) protein
MELVDFIRDAGSLPASASLVVKLKSLLDDVNSSSAQIVRCVESESNIASQVIRLANSVNYAGGIKCSNIQDAITRVGYNELYRIVGALIANELFLTDISVYGFEEGEVWESSIRVAAAMRALSKHIAEEEGIDPDTAYTIGLFYNIGILLINNYHMTNGIPGYVESDEAFNSELEEQYLGFTNADVAATVLAAWGVSSVVCIAIRQQMTPLDSGKYISTSALLCACILANEQLRHYPDDPYADFEFPHELQEYLTITGTDALDAVIDHGDELKRMITSL